MSLFVADLVDGIVTVKCQVLGYISWNESITSSLLKETMSIVSFNMNMLMQSVKVINQLTSTRLLYCTNQ
jgi:hypothetical protein